jgi:LacI family transcriptional regulator, galactose operon repressor
VANIYSVAKAARVSVATVSAVVNDTAYVSPQLKARVKAAIAKLGYQPNLLARSLAMKQSHTLGMIVPDIVNPFWPEVVRGAEDRAHESGYTLILSNSDDEPRKEELYLRLFLAKRVDGVILSKAPGKPNRELLAQLGAAHIPIVQLTRLSLGAGYDSVVLDDRDAAYEAVSHLLRLGYARIGMVSGLGDVTTTRRRVSGYREALRDWGRPFDASLLIKGDFRVASGYNSGLDLLKKDLDAAFISNYQMAVGFVKALRQYRMRCPEDVAIVTCDDHPWVDAFQPRLTTVNFPKHELGHEAARVLIERLANRKRPLEALEMRSSLTIRDSCGYHLRESSGDVAIRPRRTGGAS